MGLKINWVAFDAGTAMSAAMASGDVHISFSQGIPPFVVATSAGQDLQVVDVAVSYSENDNCVVRSDLEVDKSNAAELAGKEVGVPIGTAAHYGFLKQMAHFGVDTSTMKIVDMAPADGAAAFANGNLDMVCGWGGALRRMKEHGNVLLTGADKEAGMDEAATVATLAGFVFPTAEEQMGPAWFGGGLQTFLKEVGDFFVEQGTIPAARDSYEDAANGSFLEAASKM